MTKYKKLKGNGFLRMGFTVTEVDQEVLWIPRNDDRDTGEWIAKALAKDFS